MRKIVKAQSWQRLFDAVILLIIWAKFSIFIHFDSAFFPLHLTPYIDLNLFNWFKIHNNNEIEKIGGELTRCFFALFLESFSKHILPTSPTPTILNIELVYNFFKLICWNW